jgi:hypothetical protein
MGLVRGLLCAGIFLGILCPVYTEGTDKQVVVTFELSVKWEGAKKEEIVLSDSTKIDIARLGELLGLDLGEEEDEEEKDEEEGLEGLLKLIFKQRVYKVEGELGFRRTLTETMQDATKTVSKAGYIVTGDLELGIKLKDGSKIIIEEAELNGDCTVTTTIRGLRQKVELNLDLVGVVDVTRVVQKGGKEFTYNGEGELEICVEEPEDE